MTLPISDADLKRVQDTFHADGIIQAIRVYREITGQGLAEAKHAVEAIAAGTVTASTGVASIPIPTRPSEAETMQRIHECLRQGNKIQAIKHYRDLTNAGLAEAKAAVEGIEAGLPLIGPLGTTNAETTTGTSPEAQPNIVEAIRAGNMILAIKLYREAHGVGLAEAKHAVEVMAGRVPQDLSPKPPPSSAGTVASSPTPGSSPASGCGLMAIVHFFLGAAFVFYGVNSVLRASKNQDTDRVWIWGVVTVLVGGFFFLKSFKRK